MNSLKLFFLLLAGQCLAQQDLSFSADVTGDGKEELVLINTTYNSGAIRIMDAATGTDVIPMILHTSGSNTFTGWMDATDRLFMGNVDGTNSTQELVLVNTSYSGGAIRAFNINTNANCATAVNHGIYGGWMESSDKMFLADVTGDGIQELILVNTDYTYGAIAVVNVLTGSYMNVHYHGAFGGWMDASDRMFMGDVNGDGKSELVMVNTSYSGGVVKVVNPMNGTDVIPVINYNSDYANKMDATDKIFLEDLNHDGKKDLLFVNTSGVPGEKIMKGISLFNNGSDLCPTATDKPILTNSYLAFTDACDRIYCRDLNADGDAELIMVNTAANGETIRIVNPLTGYTSVLLNFTLGGWVDPSDRILFTKLSNNKRNIALVNSSYNAGAFLTIDHLGNGVSWINHNAISPVLTGWLDGAVDPNYIVSACGIPAGLSWDKIAVGDGSIQKEVRPYKYQLFPRKSNNQAIVKISGTLTTASSINFKVEKTNFSGVTTTIYNANTSVVNNRFSVSIPINAELSEYKFFYNIGAGDKDIATRVVCGDAYLISGQSNASAFYDLTIAESEDMNTRFGPTDKYGKYSRSYGTIWEYGNDFDINGGWGLSKVDFASAGPDTKFVGAWALKLQRDIQQKYSVPTCILNGAVGGTSISEHMPTAGEDFWFSITQSHVGEVGYSNRFLAHLNTRVYHAGLQNDISGIFWLQGDGGPEISSYSTDFQPMYNLWVKYFPNFKKTYLIQIHSFTDSGAEAGLRKVSDAQRKMQGPNITAITTNGIKHHRTEIGHEIHFKTAGYENLANRLLPLLGKDIYGNTSDINDITPPNITSATILNGKVSLTFDQNLSEDLSDNLSNILHVIKFNTGYNTKTNPDISGNVFSFDVANPSNITKVSYAGYLPPHPSAPVTPDFECYLKNSKGIAAFSFHDVLVTSQRLASLTDEEETNDAQVFPNPFVDQLTIHADVKQKISFITIHALDGKLILKQTVTDQQTILPIRDIEQGAYLLAIHYEDGKIENHKVVKIE